MRLKYKITMISILTIISFLIIVEVGYINFMKESEQTMAMINVDQGLSINYLNGNKFKTYEDTYQIDFSITNSENTEQYYSIKLLDVIASDDVNYKLISKDKIIDDYTDKISQKSIKNQLKINGNETQNFSLIFYNPQKNLLEVELKVAKDIVDNSLKSWLLKNNSLSDNDGLVESSTPDSSLYYFKGNVNNNYVSFGNKLWRIVRINTDGTVTIVLDDILEEETPFFENNENESTLFVDSTIYQVLNNWYNINLQEFDNYIASAKYCTDDNAQIENNGVIYYLPEQRIFQDITPIVTCPGTSSISKIALLTADDVLLGGSYLNKESITRDWWTMTLNKKETINYYITANNNGLNKDQAENSRHGIRPVITLIKKLNSKGNGTIDNPYTLSSM